MIYTMFIFAVGIYFGQEFSIPNVKKLVYMFKHKCTSAEPEKSRFQLLLDSEWQF